MARKLRLEFPGACYHVINRGNYRSDIFRTEGRPEGVRPRIFGSPSAKLGQSGMARRALIDPISTERRHPNIRGMTRSVACRSPLS